MDGRFANRAPAIRLLRLQPRREGGNLGFRANAGFSLISEKLYLGKPYLAWPVKRQFEQVFNAYYIGETRYGAYWDDLNKERVESFPLQSRCVPREPRRLSAGGQLGLCSRSSTP